MTTGTAHIDVVISLDDGATLEELQYIADIVGVHPEIEFVSKDEVEFSVKARAEYSLAIDYENKIFDAERVT